MTVHTKSITSPNTATLMFPVVNKNTSENINHVQDKSSQE